MTFDLDGDAAEFGQLVWRQRPAATVLGVDRCRPGAAVAVRQDRLRLAPEARVGGRQGRPVEYELVGCDGAPYNAFAEAIAGIDDHLGPCSRGRVRREHNPGGVRVHHALNNDRHGDAGVVVIHSMPVGKGTGGPCRRPAVAYGPDQSIKAPDVQKTLLLAREGVLGLVFRGCRGTDCDGRLIATEFVVGVAHGAEQRVG